MSRSRSAQSKAFILFVVVMLPALPACHSGDSTKHVDAGAASRGVDGGTNDGQQGEAGAATPEAGPLDAGRVDSDQANAGPADVGVPPDAVGEAGPFGDTQTASAQDGQPESDSDLHAADAQLAPAVDAGTGGQDEDASSPDMQWHPDAPVAPVEPDAAADRAQDVPISTPPPPATTSYSCKDGTTLRACTGGSCTETPCPADHLCSGGACQAACAGLTASTGSSFVCYMPATPKSGKTDTTLVLSSSPIGLPATSLVGGAYDTLDQTTGALSPAPVTNDSIGLIWHTPSPTTSRGRLFLWAELGLADLVAQYGARPGAITLSIKMRKTTETGHHTPQPVFSLFDGQQSAITSAEIDSQLDPGTDWSIRSRTFSAGELAAMSADTAPNTWLLLFANVSSQLPPENVDVAWFALTFAPATSGTDGGLSASGLDAMSDDSASNGNVEAGPGSPLTDGGAGIDLAPAPSTCSEAGAVACKDTSTLRTCVGGQWIDTPCGAWQVCAVGACRDGCPDLTTPAGAIKACYMPIPPEVVADGLLSPLTSDPVGLPATKAFGLAFESTDLYRTNTANAPVISDGSILLWHTENWLSLVGEVGLDDFKNTYGGVPRSITLYVKARKITNPDRVSLDPWFTLKDGAQQYITSADAQDWLSPSTSWTIYSRTFTSAELTALSFDANPNSWGLDFDGDDYVSLPEPVEVAWFALALVPPNGTYPLNISVKGTGNGSVTTSTTGSTCSGSCNQDIAIGSQVTLTAALDGNTLFTGWSGACSGTAPCTLTMNAPKDVVATFATRYSMLSSGKYNTCGVKPDGTAVCWGDNGYAESSVPSGTFSTVSASWADGCGLRTDGTISCWGNNGYGQSAQQSGTFLAVSAGWYDSCGVRTDGSLLCWGASNYLPPAGVFTTVSAGQTHACALAAAGTIACWGSTSKGESSPPAGIYVAVCAGDYNFSCAVDSTGAIACWGDNTYGQRNPPAGTFVSVSCGYRHACAVRSDSTVSCWGNDYYGQTDAPTGTFASVSAGGYHTCAVQSNGAARCWGLSSYGETTPQ